MSLCVWGAELEYRGSVCARGQGHTATPYGRNLRGQEPSGEVWDAGRGRVEYVDEEWVVLEADYAPGLLGAREVAPLRRLIARLRRRRPDLWAPGEPPLVRLAAD